MSEPLQRIPIYKDGKLVPNAWFQRIGVGHYEFVTAEGEPDLSGCKITAQVFDDADTTHVPGTPKTQDAKNP